jgi:hypothetical protein
MTRADPLRRELRLFGLVLLIVGGYGAVVTALATHFGQLGQLSSGTFATTLRLVFVLGFGSTFIAYAVNLMLVRRPARPFAALWRDLRTHVLPRHLLVARAGVLVAWVVMMTFFAAYKRMLPHVRPFSHDAAFAEADRWLFLGADPWQVTHALLGGAWPTYALQVAYNLWFFLMWLSIIYALLRVDRVAVRARFVLAFPLCWVIVGSLAATLMSSAGPCFYALVGAGGDYLPLMERLQAIDAELTAIAPNLGLGALAMQDMLWQGYVADSALFGGGITAMPSMHVTIAVLMACAARRIDRRLGHALAAFAAVIWIGSIHLGWHYALDGLVALPLTLAIWRASGWLVDRVVMRETPTATWRPVMAE